MKKIVQLLSLLFVASMIFIKCDVTDIPPTVLATDVTLNVSSLHLEAGVTDTLIATVTPGDATHRHLRWVSSNTAVATVSAAGVVRAVANGTADITVTVQGGYRATAAVTVTTSVTEVRLNLNRFKTTYLGDTQRLVATIVPATASNRNLTWTNSNPTVASIDDEGLVTALATGTTTITVRTEDGGFEATAVVSVVDYWEAIPLTVAMLSTNAPQGGAGIERLIDGDPATYFHTSWEGIPAPHYFVVNLGTPLSGTISYSYRTRAGGRTTVRSMRVEASNDGVNWTNVSEQDFPFPAQNLRLIVADSFTLPEAFSMFRFTPLSAVNHHPNMAPAGYFCMREFNLFRVP